MAFIAWWTEMVAQRTENGGGTEGESLMGHEVGNNIAMVRSLCELEWGKREKRGWGSLAKEACERHAYRKKNEREGVRYGNESEDSRADKRAGERGVYSARGRGECGAMPRPCEHDSRGSGHQCLPQDTQ
jgi:hypothetical protein